MNFVPSKVGKSCNERVHGHQGEKAATHNPERCDRRGCARPVVTTFCKEALCLDHFCSSSYEFLNGTDERGQLSTASNLPTTEQIQTADECARRTLDICMSKMLLNNLQRARLLDILLWCGNLVGTCGKKNSSAAVAAPQHQKSVLRRETSTIAIRN